MDVIAHFDLTRCRDRSPAFDPVNLVLFEQKFDAFGVAVNDVGFVGLHLFPINRR